MAHETGYFNLEVAMKAASLHSSDRLKRVLRLMSDGRERSTMEIIHGADVCAVNSIIAELRANGIGIKCRREGAKWLYQIKNN